jgi:hypothetical protein
VKITLMKVNMKIDDGDEPDMQGALLRTCIVKLGEGEDSTTLGWDPWTMRDDDDGRYPNNGYSGGSLPTPVYPNGDETYNVGDCAKGWIFFSAGKAKITRLQYQNDAGDKASWHL